MKMENRLETWDYVAIVVYVLLVLAVGLHSMCRSNRGTLSGYFLAGRYMTWLPVGASLFASNIGSEHFVGLAGSGAAAGIGVAIFEVTACMLLQLLGWVFLPVYIASGVYTLPEYMKKRFGGQRIRVYLACLSLVLYIFTKISVDMYSGALFIQEALGWNLYVSIILLLALTAVCTVTEEFLTVQQIGSFYSKEAKRSNGADYTEDDGDVTAAEEESGLAAVIYTDTLQFFIMIVGSLILMVLCFVKIGGYDQLQYKYMLAIPNETLNKPNYTCGYPREDSLQMLRDPVNGDIPWVGFMLGQTPASIWYWCADQLMVQRALAAKSLSHAQGGCILAGYIKFLPIVIMVIPGMISRVLYTDDVACASAETCMEVCGSSTGCSNIAYPRIVLGLMPTGLRGLMLAVMLAALMSDLTSIFNSTSTLFTIDIWKILRIGLSKVEPSVKELMIVGRLMILIMVAVGIIWIPIIMEMQGGQLFIYIQEISAYLSPPIAAVYLVAILWPRGNEQGAFWSLMAALVTGGIRMILDFVWRSPPCWEEDTRPSITAKVHYMYFAVILFWQTVLVNVIVSLLTDPPEPEKVIRTTYWSRFSKAKRYDDFEDDKTEVELNDLKNIDVEVEIVDRRSACKKGYDWFCGYDNTTKGRQKAQQHREHLKTIASLEQDPKAKFFLNVNCIFAIGVVTFIYIYFSV